jgi:hypothetical protein
MGTAKSLDEVLANFMQAADDAIGNLNEKSVALERNATKKVVGGVTRREGGKLTAEVQYSDGSMESMSAVRDKGGLTIVPSE